MVSECLVFPSLISLPKFSLDQVLRTILVWISTINYRLLLQDIDEKRTPGTGLWFIKSLIFLQWLDSICGILWGTGMRMCLSPCSSPSAHTYASLQPVLARQSLREFGLTGPDCLLLTQAS
jgi:hypothetical protein